MQPVIGLIAGVAVSSTLLAAHAFAAPTRTAATSIHLYSPFNGYGIAAGIHIARRAAGYCWTTSSADRRSDAYRCFVGNYIHDPCFANGNGGASTFVLCPLNFPSSNVLRINLTKRLPAGRATGDPTRYPPWAVQLANGTWCEILTGATGGIAGLRISYGCVGGAVLIGNPRRTSATWTIFYAPSLKSSQYHTVSLRSAWW